VSVKEAENLIQRLENSNANLTAIRTIAKEAQCIRLGENLGLYKDYPVSKGCTSPYLPIWIESIVAKSNEYE
jgi:hypothetical protein